MWGCENCGEECEMDQLWCPNCAEDKPGYRDGEAISTKTCEDCFHREDEHCVRFCETVYEDSQACSEWNKEEE